MKYQNNPYNGRNSTGFRFCFHVRAIAHRSIFLPLSMKQLPQIQRLLKGDSPLDVFGCSSFREARKAFESLRKLHDFDFWAITEYYIRDLNDADAIIPLQLNSIQHYLIDIMQKMYHNRKHFRYVVTKTFGRCGLTTCVQAYMLWRQTCQCQNHSYTCSSSDININPLKTDLCRFLKRDFIPADKWVYIPKADRCAFFNTCHSPNFIRGVNIGYLHFADMSKWRDPSGKLSSAVFNAAVTAVLREYFTLIVFEGNVPKHLGFRFDCYPYARQCFEDRMSALSQYTNNPFLLDYVALANDKSYPSGLLHIDLDNVFHPTRSIDVPLLRSPWNGDLL